jgi:hypothetical protein
VPAFHTASGYGRPLRRGVKLALRTQRMRFSDVDPGSGFLNVASHAPSHRPLAGARATRSNKKAPPLATTTEEK